MKKLGSLLVILVLVLPALAAGSDVADAAMRGKKDALRSLIQQKADVNVPQIDATTALMWAVVEGYPALTVS